MNMPLPPTTWTHGSTEVFKTGTWRASLPHYVKPPSPCHQACPVNGDIAEWIGLAHKRDFRGAWEVLTRHNPFPAIAGRVCHHPCETACNRGAYDEPLAICKLERAVGDMALAQGWTFEAPVQERRGRIAIVGGGPSGLSAAFQLRRRGWQVTIYESRAELGGVMRYGIPAYRLARAVLDGEIARIVALGVNVRCGEALRSAGDLARLKSEYDAVYVAIGAGRPKRLPQLPPDAPWWTDGAQYLAQCATGPHPPRLGQRVVVIGGGSAAMDVARSARRVGHNVAILALEAGARMPAQAEEIAEALEEGVELVDGAMMTGVREQSGAGLELNCVRVTFEPGAVRGQFTVKPIAGSEFALHADAIVTAIGQDADLAALAPLQSAQGLVSVDAKQATSIDGVWAGGDVASMSRFVTEAVGMGKRAAIAIDRALRGAAMAEDTPQPAVALSAIATWYHPMQPRVAQARRPPAERVLGGLEVQLGYEIDEALIEAARCFSCGECTHCDNCFTHCPDLAISRVNGGYEVLTDYCKGCGVCVRECPTGSMTMLEEIR
jgi:NADPH-dependent glutamate synthase beta subunit-like oxidoreductase